MKASNPGTMDLFGYAVGLSADGNTLAVSAYDEGSSAREINGVMDRGRRGSGAIYVFTRTGATPAHNLGPDGVSQSLKRRKRDSLGYDMAISHDGNTIAGGAGDEDCFAAGINPSGKMRQRL